MKSEKAKRSAYRWSIRRWLREVERIVEDELGLGRGWLVLSVPKYLRRG